MEDLTYNQFIAYNTCELPECAGRRYKTFDFCKLHQDEIANAELEWERIMGKSYEPAETNWEVGR